MQKITVTTKIDAPVEKVWIQWTDPKHIVRWYHASDDWEAPSAENDLRVDGRFKTRMAAKDASAGFDFEGKYTKIEVHKRIEFVMDDGRQVTVLFENQGAKTTVTEIFDSENINSPEHQKAGWQAILDNFKKYIEGRRH